MTKVAASEGRFARSWRILRTSWALVLRDPALRRLALAGGVVWLLLNWAFFAALALATTKGSGLALALVAIVSYYPMTFVSVFFAVALLSIAPRAAQGERVTAGEGVAAARGRLRQIAVWSLVAATVGVVLQQVVERIPGGGRVVSWLVGSAWSVVTLFAVPILALEGCGVRQCFRRSARVFRDRWGESILGSVSIYAALALATFPACLLLGASYGALQAGVASAAAYGVFFLGGTLLAVAGFAAIVMRELFALGLYRYASEGVEWGGFSGRDFDRAIRLKRGRSRALPGGNAR